jgi:DeoR/GlpR family transcriptional regulator of sugar metabolism
MVIHMVIKATKLQVLEFIKERQLVWVYELVQEFGYTDRSARIRLIRLKKDGLAINMTRGAWELTEEWLQKVKILR